ncbi:MAG: GNAT family N-acetyltransferase [Gemmatimonadaceae bacterium]
MRRIEPVVLEGTEVRLVPLTVDHVDALCAVGLDPGIWRWMPIRVHDCAGMRAFVDEALAASAAGATLAFATALRATDTVVGSTRFLNIVPPHRRVEIGATWIAPPWQRSRVNTEAKYLMLRHAFEHWGCMRVELKTDARNTRSREAILRLGAVEEGTFRKHMLQEDGTIRDSVYFRILDEDWPVVKARLEERLAR